MIDMAMFSSALSSLSATSTLISSAIGIRDEAKRLTASTDTLANLAEAISKLLSAQVAASESNAKYESVLREKRNLEEELRGIHEQKADFERYVLYEISPGVLAYAIRPSEQEGEPAHYICSRCRSNGKKHVLQFDTAQLAHSFTCPECKTRHLNGKFSEISMSSMRR